MCAFLDLSFQFTWIIESCRWTMQTRTISIGLLFTFWFTWTAAGYKDIHFSWFAEQQQWIWQYRSNQSCNSICSSHAWKNTSVGSIIFSSRIDQQRQTVNLRFSSMQKYQTKGKSKSIVPYSKCMTGGRVSCSLQSALSQRSVSTHFCFEWNIGISHKNRIYSFCMADMSSKKESASDYQPKWISVHWIDCSLPLAAAVVDCWT